MQRAWLLRMRWLDLLFAHWPADPEPPNSRSWDNSIAAIRSDLAKFEALLQKPGVDLYKPFRWGEGQNLLREALLIADHTAYGAGGLREKFPCQALPTVSASNCRNSR